ncbi:hypothetical protein [Vagococcus salmoninarum]|uniref:carboxylate--amine ligase n=1 Tax=Vagococcus salmoninarum TaxID=2739 RepID=UPI001881EC67|nr:hypothetical protein [Vagococcus salmoninarum]MBE9388501.1 hypothetical protein [Vagococcus salmoninarum]
MKKDFLAVILGTDVNAYGMARSVHIAYDEKSLCVGKGRLMMTADSKICDVDVIYSQTDEAFISELINKAIKLKENYQQLILFPASDVYSELIVNHEEQLKEHFLIPLPNMNLFNQMKLKEEFYKLCDSHKLPYAKTIIAESHNYEEQSKKLIVPLVIKPSNSITYTDLDFPGKKKAFIVNQAAEVLPILKSIYETGYQEPMIIQDFIPGDDTNMRVLNSYSNQQGEVLKLSMGQPLLEDVTPFLIGNYVAIINNQDKEACLKFKAFLENSQYTGFANFDMKYDSRDQTFKVFEINMRLGRSSFFSTAFGSNLLQAAIEDLVYNRPSTELFENKEEQMLWLGVPKEVAETYVTDPVLQAVVKECISKDAVVNTLTYNKDKSFMRNRKINKYYQSYVDRYKEYFKEKGEI